MALGGGGGNEGGNTIFLKLVSEQGPTDFFPKFVVEEKGEDGEYKTTGEEFTRVTGVITKVTTTHNGKSGAQEVKGFRVYIDDNGEKYRIESTMRQASKNLANAAIMNIGKEVVITSWLNGDTKYPDTSVKYPDGSHAEVRYKFKKEAKGVVLDDGKTKAGLQDYWDAIKGQEIASEEDLPF